MRASQQRGGPKSDAHRYERKLTGQAAAVLAGHHHHPVPLDGDGGGRAGQVGHVGDADDQDVADGLEEKHTRI